MTLHHCKSCKCGFVRARDEAPHELCSVCLYKIPYEQMLQDADRLKHLLGLKSQSRPPAAPG